tara:strand:+ start:31 stop:582 length:552 start_codon:yes stop_codon:yes gene_type:complete
MLFFPTENQESEARQESSGSAFNNKTILNNGSGQYVGNLAEIVFRDYLNESRLEHDYTAKTSYHYDFKVGDATLDIKAKQRTVKCQRDYDTHVALYQKKSPCHYYVFSSVLIPKGETQAKSVEFMGWHRKKDYWDECEMKRKGQNSNGLDEREDVGKMKYQQLLPMADLFLGLETHLYEKAFI